MLLPHHCTPGRRPRSLAAPQSLPLLPFTHPGFPVRGNNSSTHRSRPVSPIGRDRDVTRQQLLEAASCALRNPTSLCSDRAAAAGQQAAAASPSVPLCPLGAPLPLPLIFQFLVSAMGPERHYPLARVLRSPPPPTTTHYHQRHPPPSHTTTTPRIL
ncbi:uncharacterized protein K452DRAFT_48369 [Aplosporella prunicola CBS 121167]|uniref:Uncharacterized protein n=1 Tax=Aplosporella prunicola CBS 121167 TaxID=1176127 RepID=A0A6A6BCC4_9PEZI|nr:uncharacterized protein K452DRAFT_48369 [Aplosporella prunicola CBS 121167]KAF2140567.1 hypothetical protein K452DRAFT_48369 [Aplosporella prunicola CBS 121167]